MSNEQWNMGEDDVQMPLGTGGDAAPEPTFGDEKKPRISPTTLLLAGVFLAGMALIFVLGKQNGPKAASAQTARDTEIKASLKELMSKAGKTGGTSMETDQLVKLFQNNGPGTLNNDPPGNPFEWNKRAKPVETVVPVNVEDPLEQQRYRKVAETFAGLKLQSIMYSKERSAAMISNRLATVGTKFGDLVVTAIEPERVLLAFEKQKFELKLARPKSE